MADLTDLIVGIVRHLLAPTRYYGFYAYRVVAQEAADKVSLQAVGGPKGLPDVPYAPKASGLAGATEECTPGTLVLVGFQGGDPGAPFIAFRLPSTPKSVTVNAEQTITLGGAGAVAAARAPELQNFAGAVKTAFAACDTQLKALGRPGLVVIPELDSAVAATKVKVE